MSVQRFCDYLDRKADEGMFLPCSNFIDGFARQIGKVLVFVVIVITIFLSFAAFGIILPYEQLYKSAYLLGCLYVFGIYLLINVAYHYHKARTTPPVTNPGVEGDRFCQRCNFFKSDRTHHCSICNRCVLGMDHHCIWINQCVGSHNHRHFFLFICYLTLAALTIIVCGFNSLNDHIHSGASSYTFCSAVLVMAPLQHWICEQGDLAKNSIIFCYLLSSLLFVLVGFLTAWNFWLISRGMTYIDYLRNSDYTAMYSNYRNPLNKGFMSNWKAFLGIRRNRTFISHVLLPSSCAPLLYDSYGRVEKFNVV